MYMYYIKTNSIFNSYNIGDKFDSVRRGPLHLYIIHDTRYFIFQKY
jgi:hypothetical protein